MFAGFVPLAFLLLLPVVLGVCIFLYLKSRGRRHEDTRSLSRRVYREIQRQGNPKYDRWVTLSTVAPELGMDPDEEKLKQAVQLLVEECRVEIDTDDSSFLRTLGASEY